jgi:hypothetical protein
VTSWILQVDRDFPKIDDPDTSRGQPGDMVDPDSDDPDVARQGRADLKRATRACERAWQGLAENIDPLAPRAMQGPVAIAIRRFIDLDGRRVPERLGYGGSTVVSGDTCRVPPAGSPYPVRATSGGRFEIIDEDQMTVFQDHAAADRLVGAHELGHILRLGHGDGRDNDGDGSFDGNCDSSEDAQKVPSTLMHPTISTTASDRTVIRSPQRALARRIASRHIAAASLLALTEAVPAEETAGLTRGYERVDDEDVGLDIAPGTDVETVVVTLLDDTRSVLVSHVLESAFPEPGQKGGAWEYLGLLDLEAAARGDRNVDEQVLVDRSGNKVLVPSRTAETDLITLARIQKDGSLTADAWQLRDGVFVLVDATVDVQPIFDEGSDEPSAEVVSVEVQDAFDPVRLSPAVGLQAMARLQGDTGGDVLGTPSRDESMGADQALINFDTPLYPTCEDLRFQTAPGQPVAIRAAGFVPAAVTDGFDVWLDDGDTPIGSGGQIEADGSVTIEGVSLGTAGAGTHLLSVEATGSGMSADCEVIIGEPSVAPD